jgi:hypothetical protein
MQILIGDTNRGNFSRAVNAKLEEGYEIVGQVYTTERRVETFEVLGQTSHRLESTYWCLLENKGKVPVLQDKRPDDPVREATGTSKTP